MVHQGSWRPSTNTNYNSQNYHGSYSNQTSYNRPQGGYSNTWRPRGSFVHRPKPLWKPRPERIGEASARNSFKRIEPTSPKSSWKKAKIVIKERELSDDESSDSRGDFMEPSAEESGQIDDNPESGQIFESNEDSYQTAETNEDSGEVYENLGSIDHAKHISGNEQDEDNNQIQQDEQDSDYDQDYIEEQIDKIDNEIARLETQLASIRAKKETDETDEAAESKEVLAKNSWDDLDKPSLNDEELIDKIYGENRRVFHLIS